MNMNRKIVNLFILSLLCYLHNTLAGSPAYTLEYESPESCKRLQENGFQYYFNTTKLGCTPCSQNTTYQTASSDGSSALHLHKITRL